MTVADIKTKLAAWMREDVVDAVAFDAISDSIISIWETLVTISLSEFLGGPVQITFSPASNLLNYATTALTAADGTEGGVAGDVDDVWFIQSMSLKVPDTTERFFEGTEVGSELWRKFARSTAGASPFQPFVWDFDGSKFTITPNPAQSLSPGFFYIKRPPKTVNDATVVPFSHPGAEPFIRYNALSLIKLSLEEYSAANNWKQLAEQTRQEIVYSADRKNARKNLRVQPLFR